MPKITASGLKFIHEKQLYRFLDTIDLLGDDPEGVDVIFFDTEFTGVNFTLHDLRQNPTRVKFLNDFLLPLHGGDLAGIL